MTQPLRIYMGWDPREIAAYNVAKRSILSRTRAFVTVQPLVLKALVPLLNRPVERRGNQLWCPISDAPMATEFAVSRFCVPLLQRAGWALFMDCDMLVTADIEELFRLANERFAVMVVKHDQKGLDRQKMDGQLQTFYARKNWSSVMLWNCAHPANARLTREALNTWPGRDLHAFKWLADEEIGALPAEWNHLVDVDAPPPTLPKLLHYTLGGPWFDNHKDCGYAREWELERDALRGG